MAGLLREKYFGKVAAAGLCCKTAWPVEEVAAERSDLLQHGVHHREEAETGEGERGDERGWVLRRVVQIAIV